MRYINERDYHCKCGQLKIIKQFFKESRLRPTKCAFLKIFFFKIDSRILRRIRSCIPFFFWLTIHIIKADCSNFHYNSTSNIELMNVVYHRLPLVHESDLKSLDVFRYLKYQSTLKVFFESFIEINLFKFNNI